MNRFQENSVQDLQWIQVCIFLYYYISTDQARSLHMTKKNAINFEKKNISQPTARPQRCVIQRWNENFVNSQENVFSKFIAFLLCVNFVQGLLTTPRKIRYFSKDNNFF